MQKAQGRARPRIHWCPTGSFAFVPVHAAGIYEGLNQECCSDYVVSSYTPTLTALIQARKGRSTFSPQQIKLMTVAAESVPHSNMPPLRYAVSETRGVIDIVKKAGASSGLDMDAATKAEVLAKLRSSHVVHLACHGIQRKHEPHKSHFCLSTGNLTVSELMEIELKDALLAYLSACETAKGDEEHADEVVHLAASMLFAGFKSVVGTMW
jgi:CHAT domain-containing protein